MRYGFIFSLDFERGETVMIFLSRNSGLAMTIDLKVQVASGIILEIWLG